MNFVLDRITERAWFTWSVGHESRPWAMQKRQNRSRCHSERWLGWSERNRVLEVQMDTSEVAFWGRTGPAVDILSKDSTGTVGSRLECTRYGAHWRHLTNTIYRPCAAGIRCGLMLKYFDHLLVIGGGNQQLLSSLGPTGPAMKHHHVYRPMTSSCRTAATTECYIYSVQNDTVSPLLRLFRLSVYQ